MARADSIALLYGLGVLSVTIGIDLLISIGAALVSLGIGLILPAIWLTRA